MATVLAEAPPVRSRRSTAPTFVLLASLVVSFLASSSAPTPLYSFYQHQWGITAMTVTVVFGSYALAVLAALLTIGTLSDHIGRKPVLMTALVAQIAAMAVFLTADGVAMLLLARIVQGIATGAAIGAFGAAMIDIDNAKGALANAVAPGVGTATGAALSAVAVQYLPAPTHTIYAILIGVFALQLVGVALMRETISRRPGVLASLAPEFALPAAARRPAIVAAPVMFAVWALAGFYGSLGPSLIRTLTGSSSAVVAGSPLFVLAGAATVAVVLMRRVAPTVMFGVGIGALVSGLAITLVATGAHSVIGLFVGTAVAGIGFGNGFQGGIRTVIPHAEAHARAGVLSVLYSACYLGFGGPAVVAGYLVAHQSGTVVVAREYGIALVTLALCAAAGLWAGRRNRA